MAVNEWGTAALERAGIRTSDDEHIQLFGLSEFLVRQAQRDSAAFQTWLESAAYAHRVSTSLIAEAIKPLRERFAPAQASSTDLAAFQSALRRVRYDVQRAVVWRHLSRRASHDETVMALSALADGLLQITLEWCDAVMVAKEGEPLDEHGERQQITLFALGKLGGCELNLSSDIDLICAYGEPGKTAKTRKTNQQFFVQVVQLLLKALGEMTGDGFGFRIDLRLRPYGDSGPIVQPFAAMERYFESSGRDWERYALIKARACAGDTRGGDALLARLRPFVYRRYLDFAAIDSMREMRALIRRDHKAHQDNVKLCAGGIRDVEFLVQMLQLIWGGRIESLRTNSLQHAMDAAVAENLLSGDDRDLLFNAYLHFRDVEHCLQAFRDEQTHTLPDSTEDRARLVDALGYSSYDEFLAELHIKQKAVVDCLGRWLDHDDDDEGEHRTLELGSVSEAIPGRANQVVAELRATAQRIPEALVAERLDRLLPLLIEDLRLLSARTEHLLLDEVLLRLEPLLKNVMRRSAYLVLLSENADVRSELVNIAVAGNYFTNLLAKHPALLEELFLRLSLEAVPTMQELRQELDVLLPPAVADDLQQQHFDQLAQYKSQHQFRCLLALARADLTVMQMADYLTRLAESVVEVVLRWAWAEVRDGTDAGAQGESESAGPENFIVIGYGKLGGFELGAGSDLDLVFLHNSGLAEQSRFHQLTRRLLNYLGMQTYFGPLYEVDIRLRPAGRDGTLVSTLEGFDRYQRNSAWLWEHQALVRARAIAGCGELAAQFEALRRSLLGTPRDRAETRHGIVEMRERMRQSIKAESDAGQIKQGVGGIVDIEFMVQYLTLCWSTDHPSLLEYPDNARILEQAVGVGLLPADVAEQLIADYARLRHRGQMLIVSPSSHLEDQREDATDAPDGLGELADLQQRVARIWQQLMIDGSDPEQLTMSVS